MWVEKYRPTKLDDYFVYPQIRTQITSWIKDFKENKKGSKNCLFLYGPPGTGKTTIANIILNEFNYDVIEFNASDIRTPKLVKTKIEDTLGKKNVLNLMCNKQKNIGIIMDEIDGMSSGERGGLSEMIKIIFPKKTDIQKGKNYNYLTNTPFICISNSLDKKLNEMKNKSVFVKFSGVHKMNLQKVAERICKEENIDYNDEIIEIIIKNSQSDYRRFIILMEYVFQSKKELTPEYVEILLESFDKKNIDMTYYESVEKILNKYDIPEIQKCYNTNKSLVPMIFYENFNNYIIHNTTNSNEEKLDAILKIYKNYSESDKIDYEEYINQKWELEKLNCMYKCIEPSFIISNLSRKPYLSNNSLNYSTMLNKTSLEYSNVKNDNILKMKLFSVSNTNTLYHFCLLFYNYFKAEDYASLMALKNKYNLTMEDIEKIPRYLSEKQAAEFTVTVKKNIKKILF
jgi:replication factor C subunit 1